MHKRLFLSITLTALVLSSCGSGDKTYNGIYNLKDGYTSISVQGGPTWMNTNILGDMKKVERPKLEDDFYAYVNYQDLIDNNPGFFDGAQNNITANLKALAASSDAKSSALIAKAAEKAYEGEKELVHQKINNLMSNGINDFLLSKEAMEMNSGAFYITYDGSDEDSINFRLGHQMDGWSIQYRGVSFYTFYINYYNWMYDYYGEGARDYKDAADEYEGVLKGALKELYIGAGFDEQTYTSYIDLGLKGEAYLFDALKSTIGGDGYYTYNLSELSEVSAYLDTFFSNHSDIYNAFNDLGNVEFKTYDYEVEAIKFIYTNRNDDRLKALMVNRVLFEHRFMLGYEGYKKAGAILADQQFTNDYHFSSDSKKDNITMLQMYGLLHDAVNNSYIDKYCDEEKRNRIVDLIADIRAGYKELLQNNEWLSSKTKSKAIEKLDAMKSYVGYPESFKYNYPEITKDSFNSLLDVYDAYLDNKLNIVLNKTNVGNDDAFYSCTMLTVNAYNNIGSNSMVILQGLIEGDVFGKEESKEGELAVLGMIVGHEISHAFDVTGANYDKNGEYKNWWTAEDKIAFQDKTNKITEYFNSIEVLRGVHCNGARNNGEASSDMGGIRVALHLAKKIDNFNYDKFFTEFAKLWLRTISLDNMMDYVEDEHPLSYLRVNVTLSQFDEFIDTYNIKPGDGMYIAPSDRIAIW